MNGESISCFGTTDMQLEVTILDILGPRDEEHWMKSEVVLVRILLLFSAVKIYNLAHHRIRVCIMLKKFCMISYKVFFKLVHPFNHLCHVLEGSGSRDKPCLCIQQATIAVERSIMDICKQRVAVIKNELHHQGNMCYAELMTLLM